MLELLEPGSAKQSEMASGRNHSPPPRCGYQPDSPRPSTRKALHRNASCRRCRQSQKPSPRSAASSWAMTVSRWTRLSFASRSVTTVASHDKKVPVTSDLRVYTHGLNTASARSLGHRCLVPETAIGSKMFRSNRNLGRSNGFHEEIDERGKTPDHQFSVWMSFRKNSCCSDLQSFAACLNCCATQIMGGGGPVTVRDQPGLMRSEQPPRHFGVPRFEKTA